MGNELPTREKYEKLLFRRDKLRKEAEQNLQLYLHTFGELLTGLLRVKVSCIEKKKIIAYCRSLTNRGKRIDITRLTEFIDRQMENFRRQLTDFANSAQACRDLTRLTEAEVAKVKFLYRSIAKKIHPDLCPVTAGSEELLNIWNDVVTAYKNNDLPKLEELSVQIECILRNLGHDVEESDIPDIEAKITALESEIDSIISTDPYQYWLLLSDPKMVEEKKKELEQEIEEYTKYEAKLQSVIAGLIEGGAQFTQSWEN